MSFIKALEGLSPDAQLVLTLCVFALVLLVFVLVIVIICSTGVTRNVCDLFDAFTPLLSHRQRPRRKQQLRLGPPEP